LLEREFKSLDVMSDEIIQDFLIFIEKIKSLEEVKNYHL
jgi:hypothetical protein